MTEQDLLESITVYTSQAPSCLAMKMPSYEAQKEALKAVRAEEAVNAPKPPGYEDSIKAYMNAGRELDEALRAAKTAITVFIEAEAALNSH